MQVGSGRAKLNHQPTWFCPPASKSGKRRFGEHKLIRSLSHDSRGFIHVPFPVWWDMSVSSLDITPPKTDKSPFKRCLEDKPFLLSHVRTGVSSHLGGIEPKALEFQPPFFAGWFMSEQPCQVFGFLIIPKVEKARDFFEMLLDLQSIYTYICHTSILCDMILYLWEMVVFAAFHLLCCLPEKSKGLISLQPHLEDHPRMKFQWLLTLPGLVSVVSY